MSPSSMRNRTALVTGSTGGIGLGIATELAQNGVSLMLHGLEAQGKETARELAERCQVSVHHSNADLSSQAGCEELASEAQSRLGHVDILVNNAGIQFVSPIDDFPSSKWHQILSVNLSAPFFLSRSLWPAMKTRGFGRIINISSVHGLRASELKSAYVAAKHGLVGLTKALALEGAPLGITVNALCPGYVMTPLVREQIPAQAKARHLTEAEVLSDVMLRKQPIKQFIPIPAISRMVLFLVSNEASTVTGTAIPLDGGWCAQ